MVIYFSVTVIFVFLVMEIKLFLSLFAARLNSFSPELFPWCPCLTWTFSSQGHQLPRSSSARPLELVYSLSPGISTDPPLFQQRFELGRLGTIPSRGFPALETPLKKCYQA